MTDLSAIRQHWNDRAQLGAIAGTQDLILKELEQRALLKALSDVNPRLVLEIGCGRGEMARLAADYLPGSEVFAVDNAEAMIAAAKADPYNGDNIHYFVEDVRTLRDPLRLFDCIYTERMLINLPTWKEQRAAIDIIASRLRPGGRFLMCEHSQNGLDAINQTRETLGLSEIRPPWHNRYLVDAEVMTVRCLKLLDVRCFSANYYFLSRIVNAYLASERGEEPSYDAPINRLAVQLGEAMVANRYAQARLWMWSKD